MPFVFSHAQENNLKVLLGLTSDQREALAEAFATTSAHTGIKTFIGQVAAKAGPADPERIELIQFFISLQGTRLRQGESIDRFVGALVEYMRGIEGGDKRGEEDWVSLEGQLREILGAAGLGVIAKAYDLIYDNERTFTSARVITDIRPVFGADIGQPPITGVVVHMLKLSYRLGDEEEEVFVAMDGSDIEVLQETLGHARGREKALVETMRKGPWALLQTDGAEEGEP